MSLIPKVALVIGFVGGLLAVNQGLSAPPPGEPGYQLIENYTSARAGTDTDTYCFAQDTNGELFVGSKTLLSFDGDRWRQTMIGKGSTIASLAFAKDGRLWMGGITDMGWFERTSIGRMEYHSLRPFVGEAAMPTDEVYNVFPLGNGAVFVTAEKIYSWDGTRLHTIILPGTRRLIGFQIDGRIYIHYRKQGLFELVDGSLRLVIPQALVGDDDTPILWIGKLDANRLLLATGYGLKVYSHGQTSWFAPQVSRILTQDAVSCGVRLPDGRFAFGTLRHGMVIMRPDGQLDRRLGVPEGVPPKYITSLFVDREGNLWASSPSHILRIDVGSSTAMYDLRAGLPAEPYVSIARSGDDIVVASGTGFFSLDSHSRDFVSAPIFSDVPNDVVAVNGTLIVGGFRGAWRIADRKAVKFYSTSQDVFTAAPVRHSDDILLDETSRLIAIDPKGDARPVIEKLPQAATSLAEDDLGRVWIATYGCGILCAPNAFGQWATAMAPAPEIGMPHLIGASYVRATNDGSLLIFAENGAWIKPAGESRLSPVRNYPERTLTSISSVTTDSSVWVGFGATATQPSLVGRVLVAGRDSRWQPRQISGLDMIGIPHSIFAESRNDGSTDVWIGGSKSVLHSISADAVATVPKAPILRAFIAGNKGVGEQPIAASIPYSTHAIHFEFAEPEFARRGLIRLQTKIDGIDNDWVPAGSDSQRELTAVRDGKYVFQVRAVSETGAISEPTVFAFQVAPPWWRTNAAIAAEIVALLGLIFTGYRLRVRTLRHRNAHLEQKVQERTQELAEASAAKTMFVANMSHDIRNPLNGIVGLALALEDTKLDPKQREIIATLRECTTYLSSLVDDVLDFASIEAGRIELRPGPFVPAELLNSVVTTLKGSAAERGSLITIETDPELPRVLRGDAGRIQQILVNYVSNALKYAGGHITLTAALAPNSPGEVEFSVIDEGAGISESDQKNLFTKFSRLAGARRDNIPGTGLGLASCRILADFMGGAVGVESQLEHGARFYLRLPLAVATEAPPVPADIAIPRTSVLLVEDTDYNAMAAAAVLSKLGLICDRAKTGADALRMFAEKRYNVVLLDRNLPDMDGTEVARRMRELETDGMRALLLAVTAYCTADDRALCLRSGMDAFVGKPLTPEKLRRVLIDAGRRLLTTGAIDAPAEAPTAATSAEVDTSLLEYLADSSEGGLDAQAERFVAALHEAHAQTLAARQSGDLKALAEGAHRVLGHGRMVGGTELIAAATRLEKAARTLDTAAIPETLRELDAEINVVTAALRRRHSGAQKA